MEIGQEDNLVRLRALMALFGWTIVQVAKAAGTSRPYVSRVLSGGLKPSSRFLVRLEEALPKLVLEKGRQVFEVEPGIVTTEVIELGQRRAA